MKRLTLICSAALMAATSLQIPAAEPAVPPGPGFGSGATPGFTPSPYRQHRIRQGIQIQRKRTPDGYQVRIYSEGEDPASIRIKLEGRSILISSSESQEEEQSDDRGSYRYFHFSSRTSRHLSLPRDADLESMQRTQKDGVVILTFSRRESFGGRGQGQRFPGGQGPAYRPGGGYGYSPGPGYGPGRPGSYLGAPGKPPIAR